MPVVPHLAPCGLQIVHRLLLRMHAPRLRMRGACWCVEPHWTLTTLMRAVLERTKPLHACTQVIAYLHERGVKGFVALNVLVFDEELPAVEAQLRHIAGCGADAVIVQVRAGALLRLAGCPIDAPHLPACSMSTGRALPCIACASTAFAFRRRSVACPIRTWEQWSWRGESRQTWQSTAARR